MPIQMGRKKERKTRCCVPLWLNRIFRGHSGQQYFYLLVTGRWFWALDQTGTRKFHQNYNKFSQSDGKINFVVIFSVLQCFVAFFGAYRLCIEHSGIYAGWKFGPWPQKIDGKSFFQCFTQFQMILLKGTDPKLRKSMEKLFCANFLGSRAECPSSLDPIPSNKQQLGPITRCKMIQNDAKPWKLHKINFSVTLGVCWGQELKGVDPTAFGRSSAKQLCPRKLLWIRFSLA